MSSHKRKRVVVESGDEEEDPPNFRNKRLYQDHDDDFETMETGTSQRRGDRWQTDPGAIEYVKMTNFMCHAKFDYYPKEKINFITGVNGSGKSAVMSALIFGLGGGSKITNRGSANKNLIRTNESQATVEISLYNCGETAYRPDVYGNRIKIFRSVSEKSGGGYKLKNEHGKVVRDTRVKEELDRILGCFNIQLENPIAILPQDTAKTMLFSLKGENLYKFFMKATQLDDVVKWYHEASSELAVANDALKKKKIQCLQHKKELDKCEKLLQFYLEIDEKKRKLDSLKKELAYALLGEAREEYGQHLKKFEQATAKIAEYKEDIKKLEDEKNGLKHLRDTAENDMEKNKNQGENIQKEIGQLRNLVRNAKAELKKVQQNKDVKERSKKQKEKELQSVRKVIAEVAKNRDAEDEREERKGHIESLEKVLQELEARFQSTKNHMENLQHNSDVSRNEADEIKAKIRDANAKVRDCESTLRHVQKQGNNRLALYHEKMPKLVAEVQKNLNKFQKPPIGPLGINIQVKENVAKDQVDVIETEIGKLLSAFLVDNFTDKKVLDRLAKNIGMNITIITSRFLDRKHDVSDGCCRSKFPTILSLLEIDNANVANCLIDQRKVEKVIIMNHEEDARNLLSSTRTVPRNLIYALTTASNQYYPAPNYRTYTVTRNPKDLGKLKTSVSEHLERLKNELEEYRVDVETYNTELHEHQGACKKNDNELKQAKDTCQSLNKEISSIQSDLFKLKQQNEADKPVDIGALEDDEERFQEEIKKIEQDIQWVDVEIKAASSKSQEAEENLQKKEEEAEEFDDSKLEDKLTEIDRKMEKKDNEQQIATDRLEKLENKKDALDGKVTEAKQLFVERKEAVKILGGETIEKPRDPTKIHKTIQTIKEGIERQQRMQEPREDFERRLEKMREEYEILSNGYYFCEDLVEKSIEHVAERRRGFIELRASMCRRVKTAFSDRLHERNFNGLLKFDHRPKPTEKNPEPDPTLTLMVNPEGGLNIKQRDMKTLSGGEKSFSTVSLILALWEEIKPPFRMLDEFDVFMDMMNRNKSVEMILEFAQTRREFQYFFLTPLDTNMLDDPKYKDDVFVETVIKNDG